MAYLHDGHASFPMRLGHEWMGTVTAVGDGVERHWIGRRVTGDTMLGCGTCRRCARAISTCVKHVERWHPRRLSRGVGRTARRTCDVTTCSARFCRRRHGRLVEPGGNALRSLLAADLRAGSRLLVLGPGTIGLLVAFFAQARDIEVHVAGVTAPTIEFAGTLGFGGAWDQSEIPELEWTPSSTHRTTRTLPRERSTSSYPGVGLSTSDSDRDRAKSTLAR